MKKVNGVKSFICAVLFGSLLPSAAIMAEIPEEGEESVVIDASSLVCGASQGLSDDSSSGIPNLASSKNLAVVIPLDASFSGTVNPILNSLWARDQEPIFVTHSQGYFVLILNAKKLSKSVKELLLNGLTEQKLSASCLADAIEPGKITDPSYPEAVSAIMDLDQGPCAVTGSTCDIYNIGISLGKGMALTLDLPSDAL